MLLILLYSGVGQSRTPDPSACMSRYLHCSAFCFPKQFTKWLDCLQDSHAEGDQGRNTDDAVAHNGDSAASQDGPDDSSSASPVQPPVRLHSICKE